MTLAPPFRKLMLTAHSTFSVGWLGAVAATVLLLVHMQPISYLAEVATKADLSSTELRVLRLRLIADAVAALVLLPAATTISVYKPWGRIGNWVQQRKQPGTVATIPTSWGQYVLLALLGLVVGFVIIHLLGGGLGHH